MSETTWRKLIADCMEGTGETFADVEATTLTDAQMDVEFDDGFGGSEGVPFTLWTKNRVPDDIPESHVTG